MKTNIAIVGLGPMGQRHYQACLKLRSVKLFLCDLNIDKMVNLKAEKKYKQWKKLIADNKVDILIVASNGNTHYEIMKFAIENKVKKILCEKPLTNSILKANNLITLVKKYKTLIAVNHIRRWSNSYLRLKKLIDSDLLGKIKNIYFEMGGGQLASNGGHLFDLSRFLTSSEPKDIIAYIDKKNTPHPRGKKFSDPGAYGVLRMLDNSRIFFDMSEDYGTPSLIKILCKYGTIIIDETNETWRIYSRSKKDRSLPLTKRPKLKKITFVGGGRINMIESSENTLKNLLKAKNNKDLNCNLYDGYQSLMVAIGAHYSSAKNKKVLFPLKNKVIVKKQFKFT